jgi:hypothetical protein
MDHEQAVNKGVAERYLLGELSTPESEEFEIHFFGCAQCAQELRAGAIFEENAKAVFLEESAGASGALVRESKTERARLAAWWSLLWQRPWSAAPALAAGALLCLAAYQALVVVPGLREQVRQAQAPQATASYVLQPLSRGDERKTEVPKNYRSYELVVDKAWEKSYAEYLWSFVDEAGATHLSVRVPAPPPNKPLQILISRNQLPSGQYKVIVRGAAPGGEPEAELDRFLLFLKLD